MMESVNNNPILVVQTITYNHGKYIRKALEGLVMQQTNFSFVAIVHDDASTDGTADVIREFESRYPDIIKPIYEKENQYSKRDGSLGRIIREATDAYSPKYIAMCEGDDYWTDPLKLQKQVDFLESHPDYSMCFSNAIEHWEDGAKPDRLFSHIEDRDYSMIEIYREWIVPTASVVYRSIVCKDHRMQRLSSSGKIIANDILLFLTCFSYGKVRGMSDVFSIYRRLSTGIVSSVLDKDVDRFMLHRMTLGKAFKGDIRTVSQQLVGKHVVSMLRGIKNAEDIDCKLLLRFFMFAPGVALKTLFKYI